MRPGSRQLIEAGSRPSRTKQSCCGNQARRQASDLDSLNSSISSLSYQTFATRAGRGLGMNHQSGQQRRMLMMESQETRSHVAARRPGRSGLRTQKEASCVMHHDSRPKTAGTRSRKLHFQSTFARLLPPSKRVWTPRRTRTPALPHLQGRSGYRDRRTP